ncbi:hypothetical protein [Falsiroseomonas tokyonensis]|uniref:Uncharacterized protein n=1 Tax=Falsiroseomonas tokyonensis TaxID=430521 RepID=A0ABV7BN82_9PROT|nr:hypothetical protein [Falsiroseomonas tokyonensis]MBU8537050.1 hypothetical protein [Falsiroseomonas tokyonensis]
MDDKDRLDEARGSEDALRPTLPGGERVREGESGDAPDAIDDGEDERAAGTVEDPIHPGEAQPGEAVEQAQLRGGPVDIAPERLHRR